MRSRIASGHRAAKTDLTLSTKENPAAAGFSVDRHRGSGQLTVAVLVLLAGAAGAGFVAPDLGAVVLRRLRRKPHATHASRHLARIAEGTGWSATTGSQHLLLQALGHALLLGLHRRNFLLAANADAGEHL